MSTSCDGADAGHTLMGFRTSSMAGWSSARQHQSRNIQVGGRTHDKEHCLRNESGSAGEGRVFQTYKSDVVLVTSQFEVLGQAL